MSKLDEILYKIIELAPKGVSDAKIAEELGMSAAELKKLKQAYPIIGDLATRIRVTTGQPLETDDEPS